MAKLLVQSHIICPEIQVHAFELVDTIFSHIPTSCNRECMFIHTYEFKD